MSFPCGVLEFRYDYFRHFQAELEAQGRYLVNVGDSIQTLAVRELCRRLGIPPEEIVPVNRDNLPAYRGKPLRLLMNGCFNDECLPLPSALRPIFVGFNTCSETLVLKHRDFFRQHGPIGCRDVATTRLLARHGIPAYTSGCLTATFSRRTPRPSQTKVFIVKGAGAGALPEGLEQFVPPRLWQGATHVFQREPMQVFPMDDAGVRHVEETAQKLLDLYRNEAALVITPLLHAASPCLAMGIPVVLVRHDFDARFTALSRMIPVHHLPAQFAAVNWQPEVPDLEELKDNLTRLVGALLKGEAPPPESLRFLAEFYGDNREVAAPTVPARTGWQKLAGFFSFGKGAPR